jgi:pimeloyl-ACP methyl ester carboxylesterase
MKPSQSHILNVRGLRYHVRTWGDPGHPQLWLLHGWMDVSASFQFLVDALKRDWYVIAPDWRGFGLSEWAAGGYWFLDYLGDLDVMLGLLAQDAASTWRVSMAAMSPTCTRACPERVQAGATGGFRLPHRRAPPLRA